MSQKKKLLFIWKQVKINYQQWSQAVIAIVYSGRPEEFLFGKVQV